MADKPNNLGRKSKYDTHVKPKLDLIEGWARDGLIEEQIAKKLGVAYSTFRVYKEQFPALSAALNKGKEVVDLEVENKLLQRALGYEYEEITYEYGIEVKRVVKHVMPDTTAQIFWLKNRLPDKWRDKKDLEHTGSMDVNNPFAGLSTEELRMFIKRANKND